MIHTYIKKILDWWEKWPLRIAIIRWAMEHSLPGFHGISVYKVLTFLLKEIKKEDLTTRANAIAYSFFLSLFPTIIVLFTLIAYLPIYDTLNGMLQLSVKEVMPGNAGMMLTGFVTDIITKPRTGLLSFGFILFIYFASNGMMAMMRGFEKSYKSTFRRRSPIQKRLMAIQLTFMLGVLLVASVVLVIFGSTLISLLSEYIPISNVTQILIMLLRWLVIVSLFYFGIAVIYRYGASARRPFPYFTPGAALATVASLISSLVFSFYVNNFGNYNKLYGSIGTIIVVILWLQLNALVILIGFELNASIAVNRDLRTLAKKQEQIHDDAGA